MSGQVIRPLAQRLDPLTSLRFFAAAMIVVHHCNALDLFGFSNDPPPALLWAQGVSFFFVLSGFILTYVYPKLETWPDTKRFLRSRIARVWPAALVSLFLAYWLLSLNWDSKTALANILLVNAWIPLTSYFYSYNTPSWSVSTEFFFYLAFPFLIHRWDKTWRVKLFVSCVIVLALIALSDLLQSPDYSSLEHGISTAALVYISPAARIFEFILGILIGSYYLKHAADVQWGRSRASLYELVAILLAGLSTSTSVIHPVALWVKSTLGSSAWQWHDNSGSMLAFGLLIYVFAIGRGRISAWLSHPIMVLLGEISFSLYLLHQILLRYYLVNITEFPHLPNLLTLSIFWAVLLLASYLMWALIEMPCRLLILGGGRNKIHGTKVMRDSWRSHLNLNRKTLSAATILACIVASIYASMGRINRISPTEADGMTPKELQAGVGARFGNLFMLRGVRVDHVQKGLQIELAWESLAGARLTYRTGVHITDASGNILVQADYDQPTTRMTPRAGEIWKDSILVSADKLKGTESRLAIALFKDRADLLPVDRGNRDWGGKRLVLPLNVETINRITPSEADGMTPKELQSAVGSRFGNLFMLRGISVEHMRKGLQIDLAWESLGGDELTYVTGVHVMDASGNILAQADYYQPTTRMTPRAGEIWKDSIFVSADKLKGPESHLAITLYKNPTDLLSIDRGNRDWGGKRLVLPLNK